MQQQNVYRAHAAQARADAEAATLDNVRDRCLRAEAAFLAMADRADRAALSRAAREGAPVAAPIVIEDA